MTRSMNMRSLAVAVIIIALGSVASSGCGVFQKPTVDQTQLAIQSAGDAGAVGCAGFVSLGKPGDVAKARIASHAAVAALLSDNPSPDAILAAVTASGVPAQYQSIIVAAVSRIAARVAGSGAVKKDSTEFQMLSAFLTSCDAALNVAAPPPS